MRSLPHAASQCHRRSRHRKRLRTLLMAIAALVIAAVGVLLLGGVRAVASEERHPSGDPVRGLTVALAAEDPTWRLGETKTFDATLTNVGATPFLVDLFGELNALYEGKHRGSAIASCWTLSWEPALVVTGPQRGRYTLEPSQLLRLSPGASQAVRLSLTLSEAPPGTYRVRVAYVPRAASPSFSFPDHWETQHGIVGPMWLGMAFSNPLTLTVTKSVDFPLHAP